MHLRCPLSRKLPVQPVSFSDGNVYDKAALLEHSLRHDGLFKGVLLDVKSLVPDMQRLSEIEAIVELSKGSKESKEWYRRRTEAEEEARDMEDRENGQMVALVGFALLRMGNKEYAKALEVMAPIAKPSSKVYMLRGDCCAALNMDEEAFENYRKATDSTKENAHWRISELFRKNGRPEEALQWNIVAAKKPRLWGKEQHVRIVAEAYMHGDHVVKNVDEAMVWYQKLATSYNDVDALYLCAKDCFSRGDILGGVRKLLSASDKGHEEAAEKVLPLKDLFSMEELSELKRNEESD